MLLKVKRLKLSGIVQESGQPQSAAWLCFMLKYGCLAPIAANAHVIGMPLLVKARARFDLMSKLVFYQESVNELSH